MPLDATTGPNDEQMLAALPDFMCLRAMMKASPSEEGGDRFLFIEASNEDVDHQGEVVLQKALEDSAGYYLAHGNVDLSHYTIMGPKAGIPNHLEYEIGRPVEVHVDGRRTFLKAQLYQGDSAMARNANMVWDSLTKQTPPARWFASVGGAVLSKSVRVDPKTRSRIAVVEKVRWNNTALDRCPVNKSVPEVSTAPIGVFAKSLGGFVISKALDSGGYGTDSAALTGGAALRGQSIGRHVQSYFDFRDRLAGDVSAKKVHPTAERIVAHAHEHYGLDQAEAAAWTSRFLADLKTGLSQRKKH